jgi:hypothetical protein
VLVDGVKVNVVMAGVGRKGSVECSGVLWCAVVCSGVLKSALEMQAARSHLPDCTVSMQLLSLTAQLCLSVTLHCQGHSHSKEFREFSYCGLLLKLVSHLILSKI